MLCLVAAGEGNTELQTVPIVGRDIRDGQPDTEAELQAALIAMIPTPGGSHDEGGLLVRNLLAEFLRGFSLRTLIFLLDMVLPQLDAYNAGRQLQHLQPWVSVELAQQKKRGQTGTRLQVTYQYEAYAGFHVVHLHTDGAPLLLFSAPSNKPHSGPWTSTPQDYELPVALRRVLHCRISCQLDAHSSLILQQL